jgi:hypothetical protein
MGVSSWGVSFVVAVKAQLKLTSQPSFMFRQGTKLSMEMWSSLSLEKSLMVMDRQCSTPL